MSDQETSTESEFNLMDAADEIISDEPAEAAPSKDESTSGDNQETESQKTPVEDKALSPEEILNKVEEEKVDPKANEELLNLVNTLGAIHNGQAVKIDTVDQLKELVQKGYDYTKKTMELSEQDKVFKEAQVKFEGEYKQKTEELQQYENSLAEVIQETQIAGAVLADMKATDPDLFADFAQRYQAEANRRNQAASYMKPFEGKIQELSGELQSLKQQKVEQERAGIRSNWESELKTAQTNYAPKLAKLGIAVDWDKVQATWAADASGKLTVVNAVGALYGDAIQSAYESQQKMLETKNKTANTMLKRTGVGSGVAKNTDPKKEAAKYGNDLNKFLLASF